MRHPWALSTFMLLDCSSCCSGSGAEPASPPRRGAPAVEAEPAAQGGSEQAAAGGPPATLRHVVCAWGGVGPRGDPPPAWVIGLFDLEARETLPGLALERVELFDAEGAPVAVTSSELELRQVPPGRGGGDYSRFGTTELHGTIEPTARLRLWHRGRLDRSQDEVSARRPSRYRATFRTADGRGLTVEGSLDPPWPTG